MPGALAHQQLVTEDVTFMPDDEEGHGVISGTSLHAAVWTALVLVEFARVWAPNCAPARAALLTSTARNIYRPKSTIPKNTSMSKGMRRTTSTKLAPDCVPALARNGFRRRRLERESIFNSPENLAVIRSIPSS